MNKINIRIDDKIDKDVVYMIIGLLVCTYDEVQTNSNEINISEHFYYKDQIDDSVKRAVDYINSAIEELEMYSYRLKTMSKQIYWDNHNLCYCFEYDILIDDEDKKQKINLFQ